MVNKEAVYHYIKSMEKRPLLTNNMYTSAGVFVFSILVTINFKESRYPTENLLFIKRVPTQQVLQRLHPTLANQLWCISLYYLLLTCWKRSLLKSPPPAPIPRMCVIELYQGEECVHCWMLSHDPIRWKKNSEPNIPQSIFKLISVLRYCVFTISV